MKRLVLFVWVAMQVVIPTLVDESLYAIAAQLEIAFFCLALWYFNKIYTKDVMSIILAIFTVYYTYIYLTDQFLDVLPAWVICIEALLIYVMLLVNIDE